MTYDKQALIELRDAVVDGEWTGSYASLWGSGLKTCRYGVDRHGSAWDAYNGSLDAALSLLGEVLPDTYVHEMGNDSKTMGWSAVIVSTAGLYSTSHEGGKVGCLGTGGRALLISILNALIEEAGQ